MSRFADTAFRFASKTLRASLRQVPLGLARSLSSSTLPIVIFHAVEDRPKPYIKHLYDYHSAASFERVLDELLKRFRPLEDLSPEGIARAGADQFLVTFDDGLRSSYEVAAPILERKGIPAIHFLISDFLAGSGASKVEEKFKASLLVETLRERGGKDLPSVAEVLKQAGYPGLDPAVELMSVRLQDSTSVYGAVAERLDLDLDAYFQQDRPYITHDEASDLVRRGFMLGSHSCDHPRYWEIGLDEQVDQTLRSMEHVQKAFNLPYRYFAFPYKNKGISPAFYERTREAVDLYFTTSGWGNRMNGQKVFHRVGLDSSDSAGQALQSGWRPFPLSLVQ